MTKGFVANGVQKSGVTLMSEKKQTEADRKFLENLNSLSFHVGRIGKKPTGGDIAALHENSNEDTAKIAKDKVMYRHITSGNASDKKLNADATAIIQDRLGREKKQKREEKCGRVNELKKRYKARYGSEA